MDWTDHLERLREIMPPPDEPVEVPDAATWMAFEGGLGLTLPPDYHRFIDEYGHGGVNDELWVIDPARQHPPGGLEEIEELLDIIREIRSAFPDEVPYPVHPEPGGLIPWGADGNGNTGYWIADPPDDPSRWALAISEVRSPEWYRHPGPLTRYLAELLTGEIEVPFLPQVFWRQRPHFTQKLPFPVDDRLRFRMPPPDEPVDPATEDDLVALESDLGLRLPADYRWFVGRYGSWSVGGRIRVFNPASSQPDLLFRERGEEILELYRKVRRNRGREVLFPIHPEPGGLLPWGRTEGGSTCCWLTDPPEEPDSWPVVVRAAIHSEWFTHRGPLTTFLADAVDGSAGVRSDPDPWWRPEPRLRVIEPDDPAP